jgi:hypothetical protein
LIGNGVAEASSKDRMTSHRYAFSILVVVVFAIYGVFIARYLDAYAGGSDTSGYMNNARLLGQRQLKIDRREIEGLSSESIPSFTYVPLGFTPVGQHEMVPTYAMGLPLFILGMSHLTGWDQAGNATMWLHAMLSLVILYGLSIVLGLSHPMAFLGALLLGLSSIFVCMSMQAMSDVPALAWCTLAVLTSWLSQRNARWALPAGVAFSVCVLLRPTNILVIFPIALALGLSWKRWLYFLAGGIPGGIFQAAVNWQLYGKIATTGYGDARSLFSLGNIVPGTLAYATWLPVMLTPALFFIVRIPFLRAIRADWRTVILTVWVVVFLGFYVFYSYTHENWTYSRFALPEFGALIILMLLAMRETFSGVSAKLRWRLGILMVILATGWNALWLDRLHVLPGGGEGVYGVAAAWANENLPENAVVLTMQTSGALLYYTKFTFVRYDWLNPDTFKNVEQACLAAGRPIYAILFPFETEEVLTTRIPGRWTRINAIKHISIWRRENA